MPTQRADHTPARALAASATQEGFPLTLADSSFPPRRRAGRFGEHRPDAELEPEAVRAQAAFSPDGRRLATASLDKSFHVSPLPFDEPYATATRLQAATWEEKVGPGG